jgi:hypothetical protein
VKRLWAFPVVLAALVLVSSAPVRADGYDRPYRPYAGGYDAFGGACSVGWWQTLRYGHVRPQWGVRCFGPARRRS